MNTRINNICVIGLGYVGLTMAVTLAENGFRVFAIEKNKEILEKLENGQPHFHEKGLAELIIKNKDKNLHLLNKIPAEAEIDAFVISVATPIDKVTKMPKMDYIKNAVNEILPHLEEEQLVILRSTVPVGTTRKVVLPILNKKCKRVYLSFCPERTVEGKALPELKNLPQIIGSLDEESMFRSIELFSRTTPTIIKVSSPEAAEMIKLIDNSYRDLIFAYANQIALTCKHLSLDAKEIIKSSNFGYKRNNIPQFGFVGGACLEKDPYILIHSAGDSECELVKNARRINENLPSYVLERIKNHLKNNGNSVNGIKVFISGFAFKGEPETDDLRGSPTVKLVELLKNNGIKVIFGHDFIVKNQELKNLGVEPCLIEDGLKNADIAVFMNNHRFYFDLNMEKLIEKMNKNSFLFDGWQIFSDQLENNNHHTRYESLGFKTS